MPTGDIIADRYRLEEKLGVGAMGSVWRATHLSLGSTVAIKIIKQSAARNPRSLARFEREAVLAAKINSLHVVQVLDHGHHNGLPFIVMEHLRGVDLRQRLTARGHLSILETAGLVRQVSRALAAAHAIGLVHRDIKPGNIFLTPGEDPGEERAVVLDFGIAKVSDTFFDSMAATQTGALVGTPYYLSPEQAQGLKTVGPKSDLWALAVVAFECICGERPFTAPAMGPLIAKITHGVIPVPSRLESQVTPSLDAWFARALTRTPEERFPDARAFADAFVRAAEPAPKIHRIPAATPVGSQTIVMPDQAQSDAIATIAGAGHTTLGATDPRPLATDASKTMTLEELALLSAPPAPLPPPTRARPVPPERSSPSTMIAVVLLLALALTSAGAAYTIWASDDSTATRPAAIPAPPPVETVVPTPLSVPPPAPETTSPVVPSAATTPDVQPKILPPRRRSRSTHRRSL